MPASKNPAPIYQRILESPTPSAADVIFYEKKLERVPRNELGREARCYGTPHPKCKQFPDHKLAWISPADEEGHERWYYIADRDKQDNYNYTQTFPYAGLTGFPRITRTYVLPREGYTPLDKDTPDSVYPDHKLIGEVQKRTGERQLDNLYVIVERHFDLVPTLEEQRAFNLELTYPVEGLTDYPRYTRKYVVRRDEYDPADFATDPDNPDATQVSHRFDRFEGQFEDSLYVLVTTVFDDLPGAEDIDNLAGYGWSIVRPHGDDGVPRVIWKFPINRDDFALTPEYTACPITGYETLQLTDERMDDDPSSPNKVMVTRIYDLLPGAELEKVVKDAVGDYPQQFVLEKTTTTHRQNQNNSATPDAVGGDVTASGGAILRTDAGANGQSTVVYSKGSVNVEVTVVDELIGSELDPDTGAANEIKTEIVPAGTPGDPVNADGLYSVVVPIDGVYSKKIWRKVSALAGTSRIYNTIVQYSWPAVYENIIFLPYDKYDADGGTYSYKIGSYSEVFPGYSGPCDAIVEEGWSLLAPTPPTITPMQPRPMMWDFIYIRGSMIPTLHPAVTITETIGTDDPNYPPQVHEAAYEATNYIVWPDTIVANFSVQPRGGGYRWKKVTVLKPEVAAP